jgi:hypothetical protein
MYLFILANKLYFIELFRLFVTDAPLEPLWKKNLIRYIAGAKKLDCYKACSRVFFYMNPLKNCTAIYQYSFQMLIESVLSIMG